MTVSPVEETLALMREAYKVSQEMRKVGAGFVFNRDARESFNVRASGLPSKQPANGKGDGQASTNGKNQKGDTTWCTLHQCNMKRYEKGNQVCHSHKLENGTWCKGKMQA